MRPDQENTSRVLGMLSAFLGVVVLFGWYLRIPSLIQIHPTFVPMQYNTALGFLLSGIGLIAIKFPSRISCGILGSTASLIGGLTLIQYLFGLNFGLDEFFMEHYVLVKTSHPGRMAPNTALCFTLTGTSLAFYGFLKRHEKSIPIVEVLGAIVAALGLVSFLGYLFKLEPAFGWGEMTRMAVHTSLGFIALGSALVFNSKTRFKNDTIPPFPTFLTIGLATLSISLWNALEVEMAMELTVLPEVVGVAGLLLTFFGSKTFYLGQKARFQAKILRQEIAERKNREKQLIESETRFRTLVDQAVDSIYLHDHDGNFVHVNSKACETLGYSMDELLMAKVSDIEKGVQSEELKKLWSKMSKGQTVTMEGVHEKKEGTKFPVEVHLGMIDFYERDYFIAFARDISERKKAEEELKLAQQQVFASQKLASIGQLAAGISHEVLNPLNLISIHTQMLLLDYNSDPEIQKRLEKVQNEIQRIEKILQGLLVLSRSPGKKSEPINVEEELDQICTLVKKNFETDNIHIQQKFCGNLGETSSDKDKMRQVFLNLINNAKHAMPNGGTLTLTTRNVDIENAPFTEIAVSDTGRGIKKENLDKIFDPFFTTKEEGKGTGLGLSICHAIIEKSGGTIKVDSEEGKHTTFVIELPQCPVRDNG